MFRIFKRKSKKEKLYDKYNKLLQQAHKLSTSNRKASDEKLAEADKVMNEIKMIEDKD